jgi:flagellar biosynthesis protein FlhF
MTADVRTFKAGSMSEALDIVRREMGPDAVILHTRELPQSRLLGFLRNNKERVEITAGLGVEPAVHETSTLAAQTGNSTVGRRPIAPAARPIDRAYHYEEDPVLEHEGKGPTNRISQGESISRERTPRDTNLADPPALLPPSTRSGTRGNSRETARNLPLPESTPTAFPPRRNPDSGKGPMPSSFDHPSDQTDYTLENLIPRVAPPPRQPRPQTQIANREGSASGISEQLAGIRHLVERLGQRAGESRSEVHSAEWMEIADELHDLGIEESLSQEWIQRLAKTPGISSRDRNLVYSKLQTFIEADLNCGGPIEIRPGQQKVVALVGPTGVGKTTTIAKLAAHYSLNEGIPTGLITIDTFRIAAVEQLRTYAQIIDLPMETATTPDELQDSLERLAEMDLILIDTAGRSPRDADRIQELTELLRAGAIQDIQLVLSLVSGKRSLLNTIERFAPAGVTSVILSKLDEAPDLSNIVHIARNAPWPTTYVTTGQEVPDDFAVARKSQLAKFILGLEPLPE